MSDPQIRVLVVDDEPSLRRVLASTLTAVGFIVRAEPTGEQAIQCLHAEPFDVVLLDLNMPGMGGIATCRMLRRQHPTIGNMILTVRHAPKEKVEAFEAGADDYVLKPFDFTELVVRLRAVVRRWRPALPAEPPPIRIADLELNWRNRSLTKSGQPIHLTPNEFALLHCLMSRSGSLVSYEEVFQAVWEVETGDLGRLRSLMRQLRRKIEPNPSRPTYLVAEPGFGYRFQLPGR